MDTLNEKGELMDRLEIKGNWNEIKGKVKQHWAGLTDDDLEYTEGKEEELIWRILKKTGSTRRELLDYIKNL